MRAQGSSIPAGHPLSRVVYFTHETLDEPRFMYYQGFHEVGFAVDLVFGERTWSATWRTDENTGWVELSPYPAGVIMDTASMAVVDVTSTRDWSRLVGRRLETVADLDPHGDGSQADRSEVALELGFEGGVPVMIGLVRRTRAAVFARSRTISSSSSTLRSPPGTQRA